MHALYQMVTLSVTLVDPNHPKLSLFTVPRSVNISYRIVPDCAVDEGNIAVAHGFDPTVLAAVVRCCYASRPKLTGPYIPGVESTPELRQTAS